MHLSLLSLSPTAPHLRRTLGSDGAVGEPTRRRGQRRGGRSPEGWREALYPPARTRIRHPDAVRLPLQALVDGSAPPPAGRPRAARRAICSRHRSAGEVPTAKHARAVAACTRHEARGFGATHSASPTLPVSRRAGGPKRPQPQLSWLPRGPDDDELRCQHGLTAPSSGCAPRCSRAAHWCVRGVCRDRRRARRSACTVHIIQAILAS